MKKTFEKAVLCIDRDDDVGAKTGIKGPVVGEEANLRAANALILADPEDSDANTIFAAVKLRRENKDFEVITLTGDRHVGIKSDEVIGRQLEEVVNKFGIKKIIFVSDGVEDEFVLPLIQSKVSIISMKRIIIKQDESLEGAYYLIKNFIKESTEDPHIAKIVFGIPAIVLLLLALFGATGWKIVLGVLGLYLFIKGFKLEELVYAAIDDLKESMVKGRVSFFFYVLSMVFVIIASVYGYNTIQTLGAFDIVLGSITFVYGSTFMFFIAGSLFWFGRLLMAFSKKKKKGRYVMMFALFVSVILLAQSTSELLLKPEIGFGNMISAVILGFLIISSGLLGERIVNSVHKPETTITN